MLWALFMLAGVASGAEVSGVIWDPADAVLNRAHVELRGVSGAMLTQSDDLGRFRFPNVAPGNYVLWITLPGFQTRVRRLSVADTPLDVGRVVLDINSIYGFFEQEPPLDRGGPTSSVELGIEPEGARWTLRCKTRKTCGRDQRSGVGSAQLDGLRPGRWEIRVEMKGYFLDGDWMELVEGFSYKFGGTLHECIDPKCKKLVVYL